MHILSCPERVGLKWVVRVWDGNQVVERFFKTQKEALAFTICYPKESALVSPLQFWRYVDEKGGR